MKLIIAIVSKEDSSKVMKSLVENNFLVTKLSSSGGFLRAGNVTLMIGVSDEDVDKVMSIFKESCSSRKEYITNQFVQEHSTLSTIAPTPVEITVGGATIFIVDVEKFIKL